MCCSEGDVQKVRFDDTVTKQSGTVKSVDDDTNDFMGRRYALYEKYQKYESMNGYKRRYMFV